MSWSASGKATVRRKSGGDGVGVNIELGQPQPQSGHGAAESEKAIAAARDTAKSLLESG